MTGPARVRASTGPGLPSARIANGPAVGRRRRLSSQECIRHNRGSVFRRRSMSTTTPTMPPGPGWMLSSPYRLTLEQYERMVDEGILNGRDCVHLIDGFLVAKMTQNDPH